MSLTEGCGPVDLVSTPADDGEDGVAATASLVHIMGSNSAIGLTLSH